jgi:integrase
MAKAILFVKNFKKGKDGLVPLFIRISHRNGDNPDRVEIQTSERLRQQDIDKSRKDNKVRLKGQNIAHINHRIELIENKLNEVILQFKVKSKYSYTAADIKKAYLNHLENRAERPPDFYSIYDEFIAIRKPGLSVRRIQTYNTVKQHLKDFEFDTKENINLFNIDANLLSRIQNYLWTNKGFIDSTVQKYMKVVTAFLRWATANHKINQNYKDYTPPIATQELPQFLTFDEMLNLWYLDIDPILEPLRWLFLFSCFTGLRLSDIENFSPLMIRNGIIYSDAIKTSLKFKVPLNPYSISILKQFGFNLPKVTRTYIYKYIHQLFSEAGFNQKILIIKYRGAERIQTEVSRHMELSFHSGRASFIMNEISHGIASEVIMEKTGIKNYSSFKHYININERLVKETSQYIYGDVVKSLHL